MNISETINLSEKNEPMFNLPSEQIVCQFAEQYKKALPFPHIALDGLLSKVVNCDSVRYPDLSWAGWAQFKDRYQFGKRVCNDITRFPAVLREITQEACQPRFLQFLEQLTGVAHLIPDPYLDGGGASF